MRLSRPRPLPKGRGRRARCDSALNRLGLVTAENPVTPAQAAELLRLTADGTLSGTLAKRVFGIMLEAREDPSKIVEERGLRQISDPGAIESAIADVLAANPDKVAEYEGGKDKLFGLHLGQVMKAMQGQGHLASGKPLLRKAVG